MVESCHTHECIMSHIWMIRVIRMNHVTYAPSHIHEWVVSHVWMCHVTYGSGTKYSWVMLYMSHITHMNTLSMSPVTQRILESVRMSHDTHTNESCYTSQWVMSRIRMIHTTHIFKWATHKYLQAQKRMRSCRCNSHHANRHTDIDTDTQTPMCVCVCVTWKHTTHAHALTRVRNTLV